jgi:hypothetical protein
MYLDLGVSDVVNQHTYWSAHCGIGTLACNVTLGGD